MPMFTRLMPFFECSLLEGYFQTFTQRLFELPKEKCSRSIKFFWELQDICNESELVDEKSKLQWKEGIFEFEKTGPCHLRETSYAVQEKQISSYTSYESLKYKQITLTVVGRKSAEWIVNNIRIRERLKEYQLEKNPFKMNSEYYDVIFFNSKKERFLRTLDESILTQMLSDISEKEIENTVENEIKLLLDHVIDRDIKKLKKVKEENIALFENKFALNFVRHM
ncbi:11196_t:CDS:2 [Diversispora eburnea]|uniref:11196_t:CDS:1 n=1 Tax=Diversispora eburnea TaxID=1213867 RepID=A0A9N9ATK7_9GLOM|nr:11196_t:CDS:2 [Diversispora eburnea]